MRELVEFDEQFAADFLDLVNINGLDDVAVLRISGPNQFGKDWAV